MEKYKTSNQEYTHNNINNINHQLIKEHFFPSEFGEIKYLIIMSTSNFTLMNF